jgi:uncharacterized protein YjbI with pentapeptide repeats
MTSIFFSYRSLDNAVASRILERLNANYGHENVHSEVPRGVLRNQDQRASVENYMAHFDVLVVVIGPAWLKTRTGVPRLDDSQDPVRVALTAAAAQGVPEIPVLAGRAAMPTPDALPDELQILVKEPPIIFSSGDTFRGDMMKLHNRIAAKRIKRDAPQESAIRDDSPPDGFRKTQLQAIAQERQQAGQPPFKDARIASLGEVVWVLGAQSGELATKYGERKFPPDLSGANLSGLNLSDAVMYQASLVGANLVGTNLSKAKLGGALLTGANLQEANLTGADLKGATLNGLDFSKAFLGTNAFDEADLRGANLSWLDHSGSTFRRAILVGATLTDAELHGAHFDGCQMNGADLSRSDLSNATFGGTDQSDADHLPDLTDANLTETDFSGVNLTGVSISSVSALKRSILDEETNLSDLRWGGRGLTIPQQEKDKDKRPGAYRRAAQTYHEISMMYSDMGLSSKASEYRLKEMRMRRGLLRSNGHFGAWFTSTLLNLTSGYGERLSRMLTTYLIVVVGFAAVYFISSNFFGLGVAQLSVHDAIIESFVSFHGRGFVITTLRSGDPMAGVTVVEAIFGLFVEAILIATFSRRFFQGGAQDSGR